eukprot:2037330-Amphidinium_carterae.1
MAVQRFGVASPSVSLLLFSADYSPAYFGVESFTRLSAALLLAAAQAVSLRSLPFRRHPSMTNRPCLRCSPLQRP